MLTRLIAFSATALAIAAFLLFGPTGAAQAPQGRGQVRPRPAEGREPELPQPTIRQYKPRSTLVVPRHPVPKAKFPVVDLHGHPPTLSGPDVVNRVVDAMDPVNVRVMVDANGTSGAGLTQALA